jgi:hypothetical protein
LGFQGNAGGIERVAARKAGGVDLKMNFRSWNNNVAGAIKKIAVTMIIFRQNGRDGLLSSSLMISLPMRIQNLVAALVWVLALSLTFAASAQTNYYTTNGTEYAVIGNLPGDQVFPDAAISTNGGFVVWQDNITDGSGWGISAQRLDSTLSGTLSTFRVNVQGTNNQENPRVALLKNGGAVFVWQGGAPSQQHIYAQFLSPSNTFLTTTDILVSRFTNNFQINPAVTVLNNSNVVVVWGSYDQVNSNSYQDVYAKILSPTGTTISNEFLINQFTNYNQRSPAVAPLTNGGFVVAWVSEQERTLTVNSATNITGSFSSFEPSVDIYARLYNSAGAPQAGEPGEFLVNTNVNPCAHPAIASAADGNFVVTWDERDMTDSANGLDIYARPFSIAGVGGTVERVNSYLFGDQYVPKIAAIAGDYLITWTSLGQDGSREGVYGQSIHKDGSFVGNEFLVNTKTISQQMQPTVASDGVGQFLVVWTSYTGSPYNFDLFAQRYLNASAILQPMSAPYVWVPFVVSGGIYQPQLVVSWAPLLGLSVSDYEVYVDGSNSPAALISSNQWTMTAINGLTTNGTHSFQLDYVTTDGRRSPISPSASGTTWSGLNWNGIPYEWMAEFFGGYVGGKYYTNSWPSATAPFVAGGPTLQQIFKSGGNPFDSTTWLQTQLTQTPQGMFLTWNTLPGATYQVVVTTDLTSWSNVGSPRFAAGTTDSIYVGGGSAGYYRVVLLR